MTSTRRHRLTQAALALITFALGVGVFYYRGPARMFVRGSVGDVLAGAFVFFALGALTRLSARTRAIAAAAIAFAVELSQLIPRGAQSTAVDVTIGATFDPWDLVLYAVGIAAALAVDRLLRPRSSDAGQAA